MEMKLIYTGVLFVRTYCFKLDDATMAVVDPGGADDELLEYIAASGVKKLSIVLTHGHFDHVGGVADLLEKYPDSRIYIHEADRLYLGDTGIAEHLKCFAPIHMERYIKEYETTHKNFPQPTDIIHDGDIVNGFTVIHTPGHTPGSVCFYSEAEKTLFAGDTLFRHTRGRTDLYGSSEKDITQSLKKLLHLPADTAVYPGHGSSTTIAEEQKAQTEFF